MVGTTPEIDAMIEDYIARLRQEIRIERVVLFGSRSRNEALVHSDIDLAVVSPDFETMPWVRRLEFLWMRWRYPAPAECFGYTPEEFANPRKLTFLNEIHRGKVLYPAAET